MNLKKFFAIACLATCVAAPAMAQEVTEGLDYKRYPHMFVGVQGGAQATVTGDFENIKLVTPTASVYFGSWFTPVVGARVHANGLWNKGGFHLNNNDVTYKYKYATTDLDLMLNLVTMFGKKDYYPLNVYLIGGIGLNVAWDNDDAYALKEYMPLAWKDNRLSHNARIGAQLEWNFAKHWGLNFEVAANSLSDRYNSKTNQRDDWQLTAQLGVAYKFGFKKAKKVVAPVEEKVVEEVVETVPEEIWKTVVDTIWYDDITYRDVVKEGDIDKRIFFNVRESEIGDTDAQIAAVAEFLKGVQNGEITISAYADRGTGNAKLNMGYSKQRAEKTKKAFLDKGVDPSIIKSIKWYGDTVQPYPDDNDKNRVSIITGHGIYKQQEKVVTRKFRTEERKVHVQ